MTFLENGNAAFRKRNYKKAIYNYIEAENQNPALSEIINFNIKIANKKLSSEATSSRTYHNKNKDQYYIKKDYSYYEKDHLAAPYLLNCQIYKVDIIIPVYNALDDVKKCLESITRNYDGFRVTTYVVNDASEDATKFFLRNFCKNHNNFFLIEHENNQGYTKTVNDGLKASRGDFVITLNSDTIVTKGWLQGLVRCMRSNAKIGIVGPLSNAASWQTVPTLLDDNNQFKVNELPLGMTPDDMADVVLKASHHIYPRVPFINGFCFMISRKVIETVGYLDEKTFPTGYGEENDYCLRTAAAGYDLAIADDTYVFHSKSKSFGHEKRKILSKKGSESLKKKHGKQKVNHLACKIRDMEVFQQIRKRVKNHLEKTDEKKDFSDPLSKRILFLLPVSGGGGGVHSIVQETMGMRRIGVRAKIAVPQKHRHKFLKVYEDIEQIEDIFLGFEEGNLVDISKNYDIAIGTIYTSIKLLKEIKNKNKNITPAYYIQDYEPFFSAPDTEAWKEAHNSYTLIPEAILFAKTQWICDKVFDIHGVNVKKVSPSIDHDVYKPDSHAKKKYKLEDKLVISAMIRPKTPRRGAERTMQLLKELYDKLGAKLHIELFGCEENDPLFIGLERNFNYSNNGIITRTEVARILQKTDYFIDLSDYQAFGRTGLEAMACGALLITTKFGGVFEYVQNGKNCLTVDPYSQSTFSEVYSYIINNKEIYTELKTDSLMTASMFNIHNAVVSEIKALSHY